MYKDNSLDLGWLISVKSSAQSPSGLRVDSTNRDQFLEERNWSTEALIRSSNLSGGITEGSNALDWIGKVEANSLCRNSDATTKGQSGLAGGGVGREGVLLLADGG